MTLTSRIGVHTNVCPGKIGLGVCSGKTLYATRTVGRDHSIDRGFLPKAGRSRRFAALRLTPRHNQSRSQLPWTHLRKMQANYQALPRATCSLSALDPCHSISRNIRTKILFDSDGLPSLSAWKAKHSLGTTLGRYFAFQVQSVRLRPGPPTHESKSELTDTIVHAYLRECAIGFDSNEAWQNPRGLKARGQRFRAPIYLVPLLRPAGLEKRILGSP